MSHKCSLTHSFTHSLTITHSLTDTHSLTYLFTYLLTYLHNIHFEMAFDFSPRYFYSSYLTRVEIRRC